MKKLISPNKLMSLWAVYFLLIGIAAGFGGGGKGWSFNTNLPIYQNLSNVVGTDNSSDDTIQSAGATQVAATFRLVSSNPAALPPGTTFTIIWQDGSSETVLVVSTTSSLGAVPIPGSQKAKGSSGGGGSGSGGGGSGGTGGGAGGGGGGDAPPQKFTEAGGEWGCTSTDSGSTWNCAWFPDQTGA